MRIALAGATGNLGRPILSALLSEGYLVTVLTRIGGNHSNLAPHANLTIKQVDFTHIPTLTTALHDVQVVISSFATSALGSQNILIDASVAAGVQRFIPAEFGMDSLNPLAMRLPVCVPKVTTQNYLRSKARENPHFSWTGVANGMFLDWGIQMGIIIDVTRHTATLYNGGDIRFSATTLADVARAVIGVITNLDGTANRLVYVHSARVTQSQLIRYAQEKDGEGWDVVEADTQTVKRESWGELEKGVDANVERAMLGFCITAMFDQEYGCDFEGRTDNELLGVEEMGQEEVREVVEGCMEL